MYNKKKQRTARPLLTAAVALALAAGGICPAQIPAMAAPQYSIFDVNQDGSVNGIDIAFAMNYYWIKITDPGWDEYAERCDINKDGRVDVIDLTLIYSNIDPGQVTTGSLEEIQVTQGSEYMIALNAAGIETLQSVAITVTYDPAMLELIDIAEQAHGAHTTAGAIPGTGITVTSAAPSEVVLVCTRGIPTGRAWSGTITVLKFKALATGTAAVSVEI